MHPCRNGTTLFSKCRSAPCDVAIVYVETVGWNEAQLDQLSLILAFGFRGMAKMRAAFLFPLFLSSGFVGMSNPLVRESTSYVCVYVCSR